jgi:hypothetical protein
MHLNGQTYQQYFLQYALPTLLEDFGRETLCSSYMVAFDLYTSSRYENCGCQMHCPVKPLTSFSIISESGGT